MFEKNLEALLESLGIPLVSRFTATRRDIDLFLSGWPVYRPGEPAPSRSDVKLLLELRMFEVAVFGRNLFRTPPRADWPRRPQLEKVMSTGHHGHSQPGDDRERIDAAMRRFVEQMGGTAKRKYPEGRHGADDEGELAFAVAADERTGTVILNFGKPVAWLGMGPADAMRLANMLIEKARLLSSAPLTVRTN